MTHNQRELEQLQQKLEYQKDQLKVVVVDLLPYDITRAEQIEDRLLEVENLVNTYGGLVIVKHLQKRWFPDYKTYIGSGKLEEIFQEMQNLWANLLIIGNILKPAQIRAVNQKLKTIHAKAWDRIDLILKIFEKHAKTTEARLQIELASIKHMGPRIYGMSEELGSQGAWGNKGSRGKWETNTSIMKTHLKNREKAIKHELEHFVKERALHRASRHKKGFGTVGIVGYTNAWKSSLMNLLTKKWVLAEDKLFATLENSVGKMYIEPIMTEEGKYTKGKEILVSDTIGFMRDLPPDLIDAFSATLEDSIASEVLLHVIDASDPKMEEKIEVVDEILKKIEANQPRLYVFNKLDLLWEEARETLKEKIKYLNPICISTYQNLGIQELKREIEERLNSEKGIAKGE